MIQKAGQPRGRPRSFDETEALAQAIQVFWANGFDGVTIDDLVAGMGVGRPSLYAIFGDKQALFRRCLRAYAEKKGAIAAKSLCGPLHVRDGIRALLRYTVESATENGSAWGCLMVCVAPLVDDAEVRAFLVRANADTVALVEGRLRRGVEADELPSDFPVVERAQMVVDLAQGMTLRARLGTARRVLLRDAIKAADLAISPPCSLG